MLMKRNLTFPAIRLNLGTAFNAVTSRLGGREGWKAMKPEMHQNEGSEISSAPQVV